MLSKHASFFSSALFGLAALVCAFCFSPSTFSLANADEVELPSFKNIAGETAADTAIEISKETYADANDTSSPNNPLSKFVILARDDDFADAMSATGLAGALNAPILLIDRNVGITDEVKKELSRLGATEAYVIGGPGAIRANVQNQLKDCGFSNISDDGSNGANSSWRIWGNEAADTSVICAKKIVENGGTGEYAAVAMSDNFQDALSISSFAYEYKAPIILETSGATAIERKLPDGALDILNTTSNTIFVAGGAGAISNSSLAGLQSDTCRLWGEDGYDTSNQIASYMVEHNLLSAETMVVANGSEAAKGLDALSGASLSGSHKGVIILTNGHEGDGMGYIDATTIEGGDSQGSESFLHAFAKDAKSIYTLGGSFVMPDNFKSLVKSAVCRSTGSKIDDDEYILVKVVDKERERAKNGNQETITYYSYSPEGRLLEMLCSGTNQWKNSFEYNGAGQLTLMSTSASYINWGVNWTSEFEYDENGRCSAYIGTVRSQGVSKTRYDYTYGDGDYPVSALMTTWDYPNSTPRTCTLKYSYLSDGHPYKMVSTVAKTAGYGLVEELSDTQSGLYTYRNIYDSVFSLRFDSNNLLVEQQNVNDTITYYEYKDIIVKKDAYKPNSYTNPNGFVGWDGIVTGGYYPYVVS